MYKKTYDFYNPPTPEELAYMRRRRNRLLLLAFVIAASFAVILFLFFGLETARELVGSLDLDFTDAPVIGDYSYRATIKDSDFVSPDAPFYYDENYGMIYYYFHEKEVENVTPYSLSYIRLEDGIPYAVCEDSLCYHNAVNYTRECVLCRTRKSNRFDESCDYIFAVEVDNAVYRKSTDSVIYLHGGDLSTLFGLDGNYLDQKLIMYEVGADIAYTLYEGDRWSVFKILAVTDTYVYFSEMYGGFMKMPIDYPKPGEAYDPSLTLEENWDIAKELRRDYKVCRINIATKTVEVLEESISGNAHSNYCIVENRLCRFENGGFYSYSQTFDVEHHEKMFDIDRRFTIIRSSDKGWVISDVQYDPFMRNIYFLGYKSGDVKGDSLKRLYKVRESGDNRIIYPVKLSEEYEHYEVRSYQLTYDRIIYQLMPFEKMEIPLIDAYGNISNFKTTYIPVNIAPHPNDYTDGRVWSTDYVAKEHTAIWDARWMDEPTALYDPTVIGDYLYGNEYGMLPNENGELIFGMIYQIRVPVGAEEKCVFTRLIPRNFHLNTD